MHLAVLRARLADMHHSGEVAGEAAEARADVDDDGVALDQHPVAGGVMGEGAVAGGADDGEERLRPAGLEDRAHRRGDVALGGAGAGHGVGGFHCIVAERGVPQDVLDLVAVLADAELADAVGGEGDLRLAERFDEEKREVGAHGLVDLDAFGLLEVEAPDQLGERPVGPVGVGITEERQVGLVTHLLGVELGHQEAGPRRGHHQEAGPLVGMGRDVDDIGHVRSRTEGDGVDPVLPEHGLKGLEMHGRSVRRIFKGRTTRRSNFIRRAMKDGRFGLRCSSASGQDSGRRVASSSDDPSESHRHGQAEDTAAAGLARHSSAAERIATARAAATKTTLIHGNWA